MFIVLYTILWFLATLCIFIFGFLVGRFARKLPIIDDAVPWTLHWGSIQPDDARRQTAREQIPQAPFWPTGSLWCWQPITHSPSAKRISRRLAPAGG